MPSTAEISLPSRPSEAAPNEAMKVSELRARLVRLAFGLSSRIEPASEGTNSLALRRTVLRLSARLMSRPNAGVARRRSRNASSSVGSRQWNFVTPAFLGRTETKQIQMFPAFWATTGEKVRLAPVTDLSKAAAKSEWNKALCGTTG